MNRRRTFSLLLSVLIVTLFSVTANSEVTAVSPDGFVSEHVVTISGSPEEVYQALTKNIHLWWDAAHSYAGEAKNFTLDASAGGCFCEALPDGGEVEHMRVVFASPGKSLRLAGGLGPLQEMAVSGSMTFNLTAVSGGMTQVNYRYVVGGYVPDGLEFIAGPVDQVQLGQLQRLKAYMANGASGSQ